MLVSNWAGGMKFPTAFSRSYRRFSSRHLDLQVLEIWAWFVSLAKILTIRFSRASVLDIPVAILQDTYLENSINDQFVMYSFSKWMHYPVFALCFTNVFFLLRFSRKEGQAPSVSPTVMCFLLVVPRCCSNCASSVGSLIMHSPSLGGGHQWLPSWHRRRYHFDLMFSVYQWALKSS